MCVCVCEWWYVCVCVGGWVGVGGGGAPPAPHRAQSGQQSAGGAAAACTPPFTPQPPAPPGSGQQPASLRRAPRPPASASNTGGAHSRTCTCTRARPAPTHLDLRQHCLAAKSESHAAQRVEGAENERGSASVGPAIGRRPAPRRLDAAHHGCTRESLEINGIEAPRSLGAWVARKRPPPCRANLQ